MRRFAGRVGRHGKITQLITGRHARLEIYSILREQLPPEWRQALGAPGKLKQALADWTRRAGREVARQCDKLDSVNAGLWLDQSLYLQNTLLRDADQMSMAETRLEVRVPFLDHLLLEELAGLHGSLKLSLSRPTQQVAARGVGGRQAAGAIGAAEQNACSVFPWERRFCEITCAGR